jgi:hypothetical protein
MEALGGYRGERPENLNVGMRTVALPARGPLGIVLGFFNEIHPPPGSQAG